MNNYFIDTSALFKRYISEPETEKIDVLFEGAGLLIISHLTMVEFVSNLKRLLEVDKVIGIDLFNAIKSAFLNDIADGIIKVEAVTSLNIITSIELIGKNYITPIDSIQLATAINLKELNSNFSFVCSDKKLCSLAEKVGIKVVWI